MNMYEWLETTCFFVVLLLVVPLVKTKRGRV